MLDAELTLGLAWYVVFVISVTAHEAGHALAALKLGDSTAYHGGQVTLDPIPHIRREPFGMVVVPILTLVTMGWPLGWASAPYDPHWEQRYPRRAALMALAGPAANLLLVTAAMVAIRIGIFFDVFTAPESLSLSRVVAAHEEGLLHGVTVVLSIIFSLNLILFVFNLLPAPPLDGSTAIALFMRERTARRYLEFMRRPLFAASILLAWLLFPKIFPPFYFVWLQLLYPGLY